MLKQKLTFSASYGQTFKFENSTTRNFKRINGRSAKAIMQYLFTFSSPQDGLLAASIIHIYSKKTDLFDMNSHPRSSRQWVAGKFAIEAELHKMHAQIPTWNLTCSNFTQSP